MDLDSEVLWVWGSGQGSSGIQYKMVLMEISTVSLNGWGFVTKW